MANLAAETKEMGFELEQVQDFTPTPMTVATVIYYSGYHPYTLKEYYTPKTIKLNKQSFLSHPSSFLRGFPSAMHPITLLAYATVAAALPLLVLLAVRGPVDGEGDMATGWGGEKTANTNWCERDYAVTPYIAEFGNSLSPSTYLRRRP